MNVFIVENPATMRASLQPMLSGLTDIKVIGHAVDEKWAIERIDTLRPDVVILDISLQSGDGIRMLKNVKKQHDATRVIVFSQYTDDTSVRRCMNAGADYFFDRTHQIAQLREILWKWAHTDRLDDQMRRSGVGHML